MTRPKNRSPTTTDIYIRVGKKRPLLRVQIFQGFVLIAALPIVLFSLINGYFHTLQYKANSAARLRQAASSIAYDVENYLAEHQRAVISLSAALELDAEPRNSRLNRWLAEYHQIYDGFITMLVINADGHPIASHPVRTFDDSALVIDVLTSVADREYFRQPMATGQPFVSEVFLGRGFGTDPIVGVSAPLLDENGRPEGVVEGSLHLRQLERIGERYFGTEEQAVMIADQLDRVLYSSPGIEYQVLQSLEGTPLLGAYRASPDGILVYKTDEGRSYMASHAVTRANGWQVFVSQPSTRIRSEIRRFYLLSALWVFLALSMSVLVARWLAGNVVRPLEILIERIKGLAIDGVAPEELPGVSDSAPREVAQLMGQIEGMAIGLHTTYAELRKAVAEREHLNQHLDREVRNRTADLADKNQELERFAYTVSHDLKSPLVTLEGFLGYLAKDVAAGNQQHIEQDLAMLHDTVGKMNLLVVGLLDMSRIGREGFSPVDMDIRDAACDAVELLTGRLTKAGMEVEVELAPSTVRGDRTLLRMVFQNLVENAIKFTEVETGNGSSGKILIGSRHEADDRVYFVRDHGIGIEAQHQAKIFGVFERLNVEKSGTGIGLASVKRVVELHGGRIWVESEGAGQGSTFCFTLE